MDKVYVSGHVNPDTDTIVSAMSAASFLNLREKTDRYVAVMPGSPNSETEFVFSKFNVKSPEVLLDAQDKKLFLVDHNESAQIIKNHDVNNVLGIIDHHRLDFTNGMAIEVTIKPWACTNTIIYDMFEKEGLSVPDELKGPMLCAILSDTVIFRSPTTTAKDKEIAEILGKELDVDLEELGMEMFKAKSKVSDKSAEEIVKNDFKEFTFKDLKMGIGQIETPDLTDVEAKLNEIREYMSLMNKEQGYRASILVLTDIIQVGSKLVIVSEDREDIAKLFNTNLENNVTDFVKDVVSRKKQIIPPLSKFYG